MIDENAMMLAYRYHQGQMYGNLPYTYHLFEVEEKCRKLFSSGYRSQSQFDVCWLHDILEDTDCTVDVLRGEGFGEYVISCVSLLTKEKGMTRGNYLDKLVGSKKEYPLAWNVKVADAMCNLENSIRDGDQRRIIRYIETLNILYKGDQSQ